MSYDVIVIGAGIIGSLISHALAPYQLKVLVLEKNMEVGDEVSKANSAIVHAGYDPEPGSLKAQLNARGNALYGPLCEELHVAFQRVGSYVLATTDEECQTLRELQHRASLNRVDVKLIDGDTIRQREPHVSDAVQMGLFAPSAGILAPWDVIFAALTNVVYQGGEIHLEEAVIDIERLIHGFRVITSKGNYETQVVINAAGHGALPIHRMFGDHPYHPIPTRGQYYVIDRGYDDFAHSILFPTPSTLGKGVLVVPTIHGNYLLGPTSEKVASDEETGVTKEGLSYIRSQLDRIVNRVPYAGIIRSFAGVRPKLSSGDFVIEEHSQHPGYIYLLGIDSPGLASAPAIAEYVRDLVGRRIPLHKKEKYQVHTAQSLDLAHQSQDVINDYIRNDRSYGRIVCRCEQISEGEIRACIRGPLGARTIDGVKRRARPGAGRCQGGFCQPIVLALLAEELHIRKDQVCLDGTGTTVLVSETKTAGGPTYEPR